jgi:transglutaminase/protease-like cytokinesis protein 3
MKSLLFIGLVIFVVPAVAQQGSVKFISNKHSSSNKEPDNAQVLAEKLTCDLKTEREKVSSIFQWIASNIDYQVRPWNQRYKSKSTSEIEDPSDTATYLKPLDERVADLVIRRREAYCDGYARLFKTLCDYSGIKSVVITGYARTGMDKSGSKFKSNHTWNAVMIDSTWHLLDVTWASGFTTYSSNEFVRNYDPRYFLTPPNQFIADHYPEDLQWTLLSNPPSLKEYHYSPFKQQGFIRSKITSYKPEKGVITASIGDTVLLELETTATFEPYLASMSFLDSSFRQQDVTWTYLKPTSFANGKLQYAYCVQSDIVKYVNLVFNDHVIMRYRLEILQALPIVAFSK